MSIVGSVGGEDFLELRSPEESVPDLVARTKAVLCAYDAFLGGSRPVHSCRLAPFGERPIMDGAFRVTPEKIQLIGGVVYVEGFAPIGSDDNRMSVEYRLGTDFGNSLIPGNASIRATFWGEDFPYFVEGDDHLSRVVNVLSETLNRAELQLGMNGRVSEGAEI